MKFTDDGWKAEGRIMTPGSIPAIDEGCSCKDPRNHSGLGVPDGNGNAQFHPNPNCTIHKSWPPPEERGTKIKTRKPQPLSSGRMLK